MIARWFTLLAAGLALAACGGADTPAEFSDPPSPALYEIASQEGAVEGWLFGTIHSLPDGTDWTTGTLEGALAKSDILLVEVRDPNGASDIFHELATTAGQPPLTSKVPASLQPKLDRTLRDIDIPESYFSDLETWAAAIYLANASSQAERGNGVDAALIRAFGNRPVEELEGARAQLEIFDRLPESEQRDLLAGTIREAGRSEHAAARRTAWRSGSMEFLAREIETGILADPELKQALLVDRNHAWAPGIAQYLQRERRPFVAVGAAHLPGPDGLVNLLQQRGYTVRRIQ